MKSTTRFNKNKRGIICFNCEQPISDSDNFCSNCGQVNDELPLSIKQFVSEFFSGFFSFDTRFFNTFVPLLFKPGKVSKDYVEGKRRRYVNPFQLYLHVTIIFFLLQGLFSALDEYKISGSFTKNGNETTIDSIAKITDSIAKKTDITIKQTKDALNQVENDLASQGINIDIPDIPDISINDTLKEAKTDSIFKKYGIPFTKKSIKDSVLNSAKRKMRRHIDSIFNATTILEDLKNDVLTKAQKDSIFDGLYDSIDNFVSKTLDSEDIKNWNQIENLLTLKIHGINYVKDIFKSNAITYAIPEKANISVDDEILLDIVGQGIFKKVSVFMKYDKNNEDASVHEALDDLEYEKTRWNIFYYKKAQDINKFKNDSDFRSSYLDDIVSKISIALFFMLPIFTWFISLLYIRGKKNYTEHLVLVFNVQTVFFILLIFFTVFDRIFKTDVGIGLFFIIFLFYLYKSLRNFYSQGRIKTIIKYFILNTIFVILSSVGFVIISFLAFVL